MLTAMTVRRIARIPDGPYYDGAVCCDSDHDSLPEMYFLNTISACHKVWEFQGWNRFALVYEDTACQHPSVRVRTAIPFAAGDIDDDGLTDIVCISVENMGGGLVYDIVMTLESPDSSSYPCSLSWYFRYDSNAAIPQPTYYPPDLDQDGHKEIIMAGGWVWENTGNNQNQLVWRGFGYRYTFGDFDMDGKMNFASAALNSNGIMVVWECTGDDQYQTVYRDTVWQPNGADLFMTHDIDGDSLPEVYVAYENVPRGKMYLYMWEADQIGTDVYHRTLVDSVSFSGDDWGRISECGDVDGDGVDECIWTTPNIIKVYKAVGDDQLQEVWHWDNDHGGFRSLVSTVYDINNDGYNELITAGNAKISIFEIDAVDLLSPDTGRYNVGDTVEIRWAVNTPPRCDSLSLFLRCDSLWSLQTIVTGLPGTDTMYRWVVPPGVPDTGRIVVKAYGPGHQYDMSDSAGSGVAEATHKVPLRWALSVSPNPARGAFTVRYDVPCLGAKAGTVPRSARTRGTVPVFALGIYDAGGRLVRTLSVGDLAPGRYEARLRSGILPAGVYFCTLDNGAKRISRKVVLTE